MNIENENTLLFLLIKMIRSLSFAPLGLQECFIEKIQNNYQLENILKVENKEYFYLEVFQTTR